MKTFNLLDGLVLVAYLVGVTLLGIWVGRRQKDARDYFVADRAIPWWAVLFSIVATETSALTFISTPGLAYRTNLGFLQIVVGYLLGRIVVASVLLPRYFEGEIVTAYALLEKRFGLATRRFTSIVFMVTRALADSVRVFATAVPIAIVIGPVVTDQRLVMPAAVLILGILTIIYTYRGGMKAVVWTEILQASIYLLGGLIALVLVGRLVPGGWSAILDRAGAANKLQVVQWYWGLDQANTLLAGLLGGAFLSMASHGTDQLIVQRLLSARSLRDSQKAIIGSGVAVIAQFTLFLMIGIGLWVFFAGREFPTPDYIFPTFIVQQMPHGLIGLLVAAIVAATMSTHSGAINSLAAAATHDIYLPLTGRRADDPQTLKAGKLFALMWGVVLTLGALLFPEDPKTPVVVVALSIASFTYGALLGVFFLGNFWRRAIQRDALTGQVVALIVMAFIVFAGQFSRWFPALAPVLAPFGRIAWPWYVLIGTAITVGVGMLSSLSHGMPRARSADERGLGR
ncbi:SSS sodium solute transporter superfamily [Gemmatirosa kalamazoonensis]|uniref:SSS sodium solute transporter superfamily n=1 Tax=Gemmatirosa kalamazoonensis TaxID=861299 RepID=W0RLD9_9BACT|nr:sodium:solute symporter [Gemmatirosa kalamazoonensis]AHG91145.1 SSS sodium solute transporter superfamily [Gemmatirosa kalamazoonensis]